jgi:Na+/H+-dicarboxylate symporter
VSPRGRHQLRRNWGRIIGRLFQLYLLITLSAALIFLVAVVVYSVWSHRP